MKPPWAICTYNIIDVYNKNEDDTNESLWGKGFKLNGKTNAIRS